jgi:Flp pilus assembly protein TadG
MKSSFSQFVRLMNRRSRNGQSLLIVAFAFIGLVAFVGIAVDVGLMLVRYSTLVRAVDAAAIAAAGQIREGTDYRTLVAAAQQFIRLQGNIEVNSVFVDTCETEMADYVRRHPGSDPLPALLNRIPPSELCRPDPQKLVRVTAQMRSPTTFLSIIWGPEIILEASSVSQTAVLDVALVIDTSLSMVSETYYSQVTYPILESPADRAVSGRDTNRDELRAFRPFVNDLGLQAYPYKTIPGDASDLRPEPPNPDTGLDPNGLPAIRRECWFADPLFISAEVDRASNYAWGGCCNDPTTQSAPPGSGNYDRMNWYVYDDPTLSESKIMTNGILPTDPPGAAARVLSGLPDGNFSDLICQPFKQVRDAARRFIKRLDFVRGDRLLLVTFNADVRTIKPGRFATQEDERAAPPFIVDKIDAVTTLNEKVGVSVNPTGRQSLVQCYTVQPPRDPNYINLRRVRNYWVAVQCADTNMGGGIFQARAELTNPNYIRREAVWVMVLLSDGFPNRTPDYRFFLGSGQAAGTGSMSSQLNWLAVPAGPGVSGPGTWKPNPFTPEEIVRYCRCQQDYTGDGVVDDCRVVIERIRNGELQREDLLPEMIVDLPGGRFDIKYGREPQYCVADNGWPPPGGPETVVWGQSQYDDGSYRPSFGFCPWYTFCNQSNDIDAVRRAGHVLPQCTENDPRPFWWGSLINPSTNQPYPWIGEPALPECIDGHPDTRHFCMDDLGRLNLEGGSCDPRYDPDDYTRDQADIAGLIEFSDKMRGNFISMFTIFFAQRDPQGRLTNIAHNILGVKVLRYIADAGDNGVIDNHLQAWYRATRPNYSQMEAMRNLIGDGQFPPPGHGAYRVVRDGVTIVDPTRPPDPCAYYDYTHPRLRSVLPGDRDYEEAARQNCGQFWFAKDIRAVNDAFTEIAGRLFTRLSR